MDDVRELLERARAGFRMPDDALERLRRRRERTRRNQRIASGLIAFVVFAGGIGGLVLLVRGGERVPLPAQVTTAPTPSTVPLATFPHPVDAIQFVDQMHGWIAAGNQLFATTDGGRTWQRGLAAPGIESFRQLDFVDALHGWAISTTLPGQVWRTIDGGRSWVRLPEPSKLLMLRSVAFVTSTDGWGVAFPSAPDPIAYEGLLEHTVDGGRTWAVVPTPAGAQSVCFANAVTGWVAVGTHVYLTVDGGSTWDRTLSIVFPRTGPFDEVHCAGGAAYVMFRGGAAAGNESYRVYRTLYGGARWDWQEILANLDQVPGDPNVPSIDAYAGPFQVLAPGTAVFIGSCPACGFDAGSVSITTAGGAPFSHHRITSPQSMERADAVWFVDANHGWAAVEAYGTGTIRILVTADAGATWQEVFPPTG